MKFFEKFKKTPVVFYLLELIYFIGTCIIEYNYYLNYVNWNETVVILIWVALAVIYGVLGMLIGMAAGRGWLPILIEALAFAAFAIVQAVLCDVIIKSAIGMSNVAAGTAAQIIYYVSNAIMHIFLIMYTLKIFWKYSKVANAVIVSVMILAMTFFTMYPTLYSTFGKSIASFSLKSEPCVFVGDDCYVVIFATSQDGTGEVLVEKDGQEYRYYDQINGVQRFVGQFHRVEIPKDILNGGSYTISSRQTLDTTSYGIPLGKTVTGKTYTFHDYSGTGDVSFLCVSDVQGPYEKAQQATKEAAKTHSYDFVLMLGDSSSQYNSYEKDFIEPILKVAASASRSEIPCYYVIGNHENKGTYAKYLNDLIPTPSKDNQLYYTFTVGDAFFTALNFGDDHNDEMARYNGINHFNAYKDAEYTWLTEEVMQAKEYESYTYNIVLSHIPVLMGQELYTYDYVCSECNQKHDYKWREFTQAYLDMGVDYVVSGHTHSEPREVSVEGCPFKNLQVGSKYNGGQSYRNSIVTLRGGQITYEVYQAE